MDKHTPAQRSFNMSRIKSKNTKPEIFVFEKLKELDIIFEKHYKISGTPDIAFPDKKIAVFVCGEFWHGRRYKQEKDKYPEFWINKIKVNMKRDRKNFKILKNEGWKVIRIWDQDLKKNPEKEIKKIVTMLGKTNL